MIGLLKPGGHFVYFVEHSTKTAPKDPDKTWVSDGEGNALHWPLSDFGEEGPRAENWLAGASLSTIASSPPCSMT